MKIEKSIAVLRLPEYSTGMVEVNKCVVNNLKFTCVVNSVNKLEAIKSLVSFSKKSRSPKLYMVAPVNMKGYLWVFLVSLILRPSEAFFHVHNRSFQLNIWLKFVLKFCGEISLIFLSNKLALIKTHTTYNIFIVPNFSKLEKEFLLNRSAKDYLRVGYLGNFIKAKGYDKVLNLRDSLDSNISISIAGRFLTKKDKLNFYASRSNQILLNKVDWNDEGIYGEDLEDFYTHLDVLLFPTIYKHEAFPLVILEALAHGCYIIAYDTGGIADILKEEWIGLCVDDESFIGSVKDLEGSEYMTEGYRKKRMEYYRNNYSKQKFLNTMEKVLEIY
jgi:glycosyltransferase involved in cell wall biosynthesis